MSVTRVGPRRGQQPSDSNQWLPPWLSSKLIPNTWGWVLSRTTCPFGAVPFLESVEGFRERQEGNVGSGRGRIKLWTHLPGKESHPDIPGAWPCCLLGFTPSSGSLGAG